MSPMYVYIQFGGHLLRWYPVNNHRRSDLLVVMSRMMLAWVVSSIGTAFCPKKVEETLCFAAFEPLKSHIVGW